MNSAVGVPKWHKDDKFDTDGDDEPEAKRSRAKRPAKQKPPKEAKAKKQKVEPKGSRLFDPSPKNSDSSKRATPSVSAHSSSKGETKTAEGFHAEEAECMQTSAETNSQRTPTAAQILASMEVPKKLSPLAPELLNLSENLAKKSATKVLFCFCS